MLWTKDDFHKWIRAILSFSLSCYSTTSTLSAGSTGSQARLIQSSHAPETFQPMHVEELGKQTLKTIKVDVHNAKARSPSRSPQRQNSLPKNDSVTQNGGILKKDLSPNHSRKSTPNHSRKSSPCRSRRSSPSNHSRSNSKGSDASPATSKRSSPKMIRKSRDNSPKTVENGKKKALRDTSPNVQGENCVKSPKRKSSLKKTSRSLSIDAPTCVECYLSGKGDQPG